MKTLKELKEERASLNTTVQDLAKLEEISDEQRSTFDSKISALDVLDKLIASEERRQDLNAIASKVIEDVAERTSTDPKEVRKEYEAAFRSFMRGDVSAEDKKILKRGNTQSTSGALGGYTIPVGFSEMLEKAMLYYTPFNNPVFTSFNTATGNDFHWPTVNDTSNKAYPIAEEADASTAAVAAPFAEVVFKAYKYTSGWVAVNYELVEDSFFDIGAILAELFGQRMGRGLAEAFTTGNGTTAPQGIVTGALAGATTLTATAITRDDILSLIHSVDPVYRANGVFMMHDSTLKAIKSIDFGTADARPLYQVSAIAGEAPTIEGYKFIVNNDMDEIAAGKVSMIFGEFSKFKIRNIAQPRMKVDMSIFVKTDQIGMGLFQRVDSKVLDAGTGPIKKLTQKA